MDVGRVQGKGTANTTQFILWEEVTVCSDLEAGNVENICDAVRGVLTSLAYKTRAAATSSPHTPSSDVQSLPTHLHKQALPWDAIPLKVVGQDVLKGAMVLLLEVEL